MVDIKPDNMEELTEVITSVQFHPFNCSLLTFSSSRGAIKVRTVPAVIVLVVSVYCYCALVPVLYNWHTMLRQR